jgi:hypothetical protein
VHEGGDALVPKRRFSVSTGDEAVPAPEFEFASIDEALDELKRAAWLS